MELFTKLDGNTVVLVITIVFSAGALWEKLHAIEKRLEKIDTEKHAERIAVIESKLGLP